MRSYEKVIEQMKKEKAEDLKNGDITLLDYSIFLGVSGEIVKRLKKEIYR